MSRLEDKIHNLILALVGFVLLLFAGVLFFVTQESDFVSSFKKSLKRKSVKSIAASTQCSSSASSQESQEESKIAESCRKR